MNDKLINKRKEKNYSVSYIADRVGITEQYYRYIEQDKRIPHYKTMIKIANLFNVKPDYFFYLPVQRKVELKENNQRKFERR